MDDNAYAGMIESALSDANRAASQASAAKAIQFAQGSCDKIVDDSTRASYQARIDAARAAMSSTNWTTTASAFAQTDAHLQQDATFLNADPLYRETQGNLTGNPDSARANADSGAKDNFINPESLNGGIVTWAEKGGLRHVFNASTTGDQDKAPNLKLFGFGLGLIAIAVAGVAAAIYLGGPLALLRAVRGGK